jgi:hypothetical protein
MNSGRLVFSQVMDFLPKYEVQQMCKSVTGATIGFVRFHVTTNFSVWPLLNSPIAREPSRCP